MKAAGLTRSLVFPLALVLLSVFFVSCAKTESVDVPVINLDMPSDPAASSSDTSSDTTSDDSAPPAQTDTQGIATADLRLREGPNGAVLALIPKGTLLPLLDINGEWYQVEYDGKTGYASANFIEVQESPQEFNGAGLVNAKSLNVRERPDADSPSLGVLKKDDEVTITGSVSGWYRIDYKGAAGYVAERFVTLP